MIVLYRYLIQLPDMQAEISLTVSRRQTEAHDQIWEAWICYPRLMFSSEAIKIMTVGEYILGPCLPMAVFTGDLKVATCTSSFVMECEIYALENLLHVYYSSRAGAIVESITVGIGQAKWFYDIARQTRMKFYNKTSLSPLVEQARRMLPSSVRSYFDSPSLLGNIPDQTWSDMRDWCRAGNITRVSECIESILKSAEIDPSIIGGDKDVKDRE